MAKLFYRYGAMNCGKTTAMIQVAHNYEERGMKVFVIKPMIDTKGKQLLVSRIGVTRSADYLTQQNDDIFDIIKTQNEKSPISCVLCDESQFFSEHQAEQLFWVTVKLDIPVICYGLRTDFQMKGFPGSTRLLELAHNIEELKTICECGRKALLNGRMVGGNFVFEGMQVAIDNENQTEYRSLCPQCYTRIKRESLDRQK